MRKKAQGRDGGMAERLIGSGTRRQQVRGEQMERKRKKKRDGRSVGAKRKRVKEMEMVRRNG